MELFVVLFVDLCRCVICGGGYLVIPMALRNDSILSSASFVRASNTASNGRTKRENNYIVEGYSYFDHIHWYIEVKDIMLTCIDS